MALLCPAPVIISWNEGICENTEVEKHKSKYDYISNKLGQNWKYMHIKYIVIIHN